MQDRQAPTLNPDDLTHNFIAPRAAVNGSLFSSLVFRGRCVRPRYTQKTLISAQADTQVYQTGGERLDQGDADVYFALVRTAVQQAGDFSSLQVKAGKLLRDIGRVDGTLSREWLESSLERLTKATFEFAIPELPARETTLLRVAAPLNEARSGFMVVMADGMMDVYEAGKTLIKYTERIELGTDTLAKSLHSFFSSHNLTQEGRFSVDQLMKVTGRESMQKSKFKAGLAESVANLQMATGWSIKLAGEVLTVKQAKSVAPPPLLLSATEQVPMLILHPDEAAAHAHIVNKPDALTNLSVAVPLSVVVSGADAITEFVHRTLERVHGIDLLRPKGGELLGGSK